MSISNGVISATDTTYSNATTSTAGLMSASDKTKLDSTDSNYAHTLTMSYTASTNGLNIGIADLNGNVLDEGIVEITNIPEKMSDLTNDSGYVKNTDYATGTGGVVKSGAECFKVDTIGRPYCDDLNYATYQNISDTSFMSKGTLENVLAERQKKIDYYESLIDQIIPTTTGEGTDISLNTIQADMSIDIKGNTTQDTLTGKNLFMPRLTIDDNDIYKNACNLTLDGDEFTFVATGTDMYFGQIINTGSAYVSSQAGNLIEVGDMTNVWYKFTNTNMNRVHITAYDSNKISLGYTGITGTTGTYTIPSNAKYISARIGKTDAVSGTTYKTKFILASGTTITDYEAYCGGIPSPNPDFPQDIKVVTGDNTITISNEDDTETQTQLISLGNIEFCKIGNYKDYPYKSGDKWYKKQVIGKINLIASGWTLNRSTTPYVFGKQVNDYKRTNELICVCSHFIAVTNGTYGSMTNGQVKFRYYTDSDNVLYICTDLYSTLTDFYSFLNANNVTLYYVLATPQDIEITDTTLINQLNNIDFNSYNPVTNISTDKGLMIIYAEALGNIN